MKCYSCNNEGLYICNWCNRTFCKNHCKIKFENEDKTSVICLSCLNNPDIERYYKLKKKYNGLIKEIEEIVENFKNQIKKKQLSYEEKVNE